MLNRFRQEFFDIRAREGPIAFGLSFFFFLVIAVFWVMKPIKKGALISYYATDPLHVWGLTFGGAEVEQIAKGLNMIVVYGVVIVFTLLVRRLQRQRIIYLFCGFLSVLLAYFAVAMDTPGAVDVWSFYVFGDVFNSMMVALFWAFANDINPPAAAKRLYGIVGLGGVVGGAVGATYVSSMVQSLGRTPLLLTCIGAMVLIAGITYVVNRRAGGAPGPTQTPAHTTPSAAIEGAKMVAASKYLLAILGLIVLYEVVSNIIEFQLSAMVELHVAAGTAQDAFFGRIGQYISIGSILIQLFITSFVMTRFGVQVALLVLPVVNLLLSGGFLVVPALTLAAALSVADNSLYYSITQSAKESLYTPTSRDVKYKAKAFIDMFGQRFAKVLAVGLNLAFAAFIGLQAVHWLSVVSILVLSIWIVVVRFVGQRFAARATQVTASSPVAAS